VGIAVVSLIVLALVGALGGLVLARVFGAAAARNEDRPGGAGDDEEEGRGREGPGEEGPNEEAGKGQAGRLLGAAIAALGALTGAAGAVAAMFQGFLPGAVPATSAGILMGMVGYFLGARRLGRAAAILSAVALVLGAAASQGLVPGVEQSDHQLLQKEPRASGE
jgi:hypothetical protein